METSTNILKTSEQVSLANIKRSLNRENVKQKFSEMLGQKAVGFIASVSTAVTNNKLLHKADPDSIIMAAGIAATLDLPINPNLGFAAIVPYGNQASFQLMYKGLIELCQRSGQFLSIIDEVVYEGQLIRKNKFTGEYEFNEDAKKSNKVIGYMAYFKLVNGFSKTSYMTYDEVKAHALKYSQSYKKNYGVWADDFDIMARKTVLKLLLAKYAPKSIEVQKAIMYDQSVVKGDIDNIECAEAEYIDNDTITTDERKDELRENTNPIDLP
ncbi:MAG: recombinase RecT [Rikenellaceae bacterium]